MIPILYAADETTFSHNGIGRLVDCTECVVTEERNGIYECEFSYPITGQYYSEISLDRLVMAKPNEMSDDQLFRIYRISKPIKGIVKVYCQHISYDLITNVCKPFKLLSATALEALQGILNNCYHSHGFTCQSTASGTHEFEIKVPTAARACLGGTEGSLLDTFGGEFEFNNYLIKLHGHRGQDTGVTILYGKNLTDVKSDTNLSNTYNAIFPYAVDEEDDTPVHTLDGNTKIITISGAATYGEPRTLAVDLTDRFDLTEEDITSAKLQQYANDYLSENDLKSIYQNIEISFVQLWQTEEYKNVALLERVGLCDTVTVRYEKLGIDATAKVIKTVYNVLTEKYEKIELGNVKSNFVDAVRKEAEKKIQQAEEDNRSALQRAIDNATALITGQEGGNVVINTDTNGKPKEILIMNTDNIQTANKVWRWNLGGLGYSSTGYSGTYGIAMTMDGAIVANYITSGTMSGERIEAGTLSATKITTGIIKDANNYNYWNLETGEFRLTGNTKVGTASSNVTLSSYVSSAASGALTQSAVFNALTNNGALQGVYMSNGELYINASYIQSGAINASLITTGSMSADRITTGSLSADRISAGTIASNDNKTKFNLTQGVISSEDVAGNKATLSASKLKFTSNTNNSISIGVSSNGTGIHIGDYIEISEGTNSHWLRTQLLQTGALKSSGSIQITDDSYSTTYGALRRVEIVTSSGSFTEAQLDVDGVICDYIKMNGDKYKPRMVNINGTNIYVLAKETT